MEEMETVEVAGRLIVGSLVMFKVLAVESQVFTVRL